MTTPDRDPGPSELFTPDQIRGTVPYALRVSAAWAWRLIVVGAVLALIFSFLGNIIGIVVPLVVAALIAAPLGGAVDRLSSWRIPRGIGAAVVILALIGVITALFTLAGASIAQGFDELRLAAIEGFNEFLAWLESGPLHIGTEQLQQAVDDLFGWLQDNILGLASGVGNVTGAVGSVFAGIVIGLFALFFLLRDGRTIWLWIVRLLPGHTDQRVDRAGLNAWRTLAKYTSTNVTVALIDGVLIGLGAWIIGVPLAMPIGILVFLFSFIPWLGAFIAGAIATLVALFGGGIYDAIWMLVVVLVVQALEGNVLYPFLFGKAASMHPLVILLTVSIGTLVMGIVGAVIAVPMVSFAYAFIVGLRREFTLPPEDPPMSQQIPILAKRTRESFGKAREALKTGEIHIRPHAAQQDLRTGDLPTGSTDEDMRSTEIRTRKPGEDEE